MINSELDSSILSDFLDHYNFDNPNSTVPCSDNMRHLSFEEYYNEVVTALDLNTSKYALQRLCSDLKLSCEVICMHFTSLILLLLPSQDLLILLILALRPQFIVSLIGKVQPNLKLLNLR